MTAALVALSAGGAIIVVVVLSLIASRLAGLRQNWTAVALQGGTGILVTAAALLTGLTGILPVFAVPTVALGGLFASVVTLVSRERGASEVSNEVSGAIFAGILTLVVYVPIISIVFTTWFDPFSTGIGVIDLGAALPTEVAAGSAVLAVILVGRRDGPVTELAVARSSSLIVAAAVLVVAWLAWLAGLELTIDKLALLIVSNGILMAVCGALAWAIVERARFRRNTVAGTVLGVLAGLAAATPAAGYLAPLLAAITALVAGAFCALVSGRDSLSAARRISGVLVVGGGLSVALLGFLAKDVGFIYTGQPELFFGQLTGVVGAGAAGFVVALLVTIAMRKFAVVRRPSPSPRRRH